MVVNFDPRPLHDAILGLYREATGPASSEILASWAELIRLYGHRICSSLQDDARLWRVWESVDENLTFAWTLDDLARIASISNEHLRRLCRRQLGRTPMQQVAFLRVRRAAAMLLSSPLTSEAIAHQVGYSDRYGFAAAFERNFGQTPAHFRKQAVQR